MYASMPSYQAPGLASLIKCLSDIWLIFQYKFSEKLQSDIPENPISRLAQSSSEIG